MRTGTGGAPDGSGAEAPGRWKKSPPQVQSVEGGADAAQAGANRPGRPPVGARFSPPSQGRGRADFGGGQGGERGGGWRPGGTWISPGGPGQAVAGMSSGEDGGPERSPELQVEAEEMRQGRETPLSGREASDGEAARGLCGGIGG